MKSASELTKSVSKLTAQRALRGTNGALRPAQRRSALVLTRFHTVFIGLPDNASKSRLVYGMERVGALGGVGDGGVGGEGRGGVGYVLSQAIRATDLSSGQCPPLPPPLTVPSPMVYNVGYTPV